MIILSLRCRDSRVSGFLIESLKTNRISIILSVLMLWWLKLSRILGAKEVVMNWECMGKEEMGIEELLIFRAITVTHAEIGTFEYALHMLVYKMYI